MFHTLEPHMPTAKKHVEYLSRSRNSVELFQIFPDSDESNVRPQFLVGTLEQLWPKLVELNRAGGCIALTVNQTDLKGRKSENVVRIRAFFSDDDDNLNLPIPMDPPSFRVISKSGPHKYYLCKGMLLSEFKEIQKTIAEVAQTDSQVCDLPRAMRLAGFFHMKDPKNPFFVRIESQFEADLEAELDSGGCK